MKLDDNRLRSLFKGYIASRIPINRKKCPSINEIDRFFSSSVSWRQKKKLIDHFSNCAYCTRDFGLLKEFHIFQTSIDIDIIPLSNNSNACIHTIKTTLFRPFYWRLAWALIGFTLIAFSIDSIFLKQAQLKGQRASTKMISIFYPSRQHSLSKPLVFQWQRHSRAQYYIIELFDENLLPVWKSDEIYNFYFILPEAVLAHLISEKTYYWMVTSYSNLERVNESELIGFKLRGKMR